MSAVRGCAVIATSAVWLCLAWDAIAPVIFFFFNDPATTEFSPLSLHAALPISKPTRHPPPPRMAPALVSAADNAAAVRSRSEEHTSRLQSPCNLVCRLLLE